MYAARPQRRDIFIAVFEDQRNLAHFSVFIRYDVYMVRSGWQRRAAWGWGKTYSSNWIYSPRRVVCLDSASHAPATGSTTLRAAIIVVGQFGVILGRIGEQHIKCDHTRSGFGQELDQVGARTWRAPFAGVRP